MQVNGAEGAAEGATLAREVARFVEWWEAHADAQHSIEERERVGAVFVELVGRLSARVHEAPDEARRLARGLFEALRPAVEGTTFVWRSLVKPNGYSGDAGAMEALYDGPRFDAAGAAGLLDACVTALPAGQAVRNRRRYLARHIERVLDAHGEAAQLTCLASGPARELVDVFSARNERPRLTLIDIDGEALAGARARLTALGFDGSLTVSRANVLALADGRRSMPLDGQHLIYSAGLIDYFTDDEVARVASWCRAHLVEGGTMVLGNFHPVCPTKILLELFLDWPLYYRDALDLDRVLRRSTFGRGCDAVEREPTGVNLFAVQWRGGGR